MAVVGALLASWVPSGEASMPKQVGSQVVSQASKEKPSDATVSALAKVHEHTLPNGLKVRLVPSNVVPTVSYYTFFRVGSRNEGPGITGISHLFEHMMFNGAKKYGPGEFDRELESSGGTSNAYTSTDLTVYYEDFAADALEKVIDLESDRMRSLAISDRMLKSEREVVLEERRLRVDNEIFGMLDEELGALMWKAHPYRWPVIGWQKDIERITKEDCLRFFRTYYAPNNATIYVVGDIDPKKALAMIARAYGRIPKGPPPPEVFDAEPEQRGERRAEVRYPAQAPSMLIGYRGPAARDDDTLVLDVLQYVLSIGQSSRLNRRLVYERELVVAVTVDWTWRIDPGVFLFALELRPDSNPDEVERALYAELADVAQKGVTARELEQAKNNLKAHLWRELATNNRRANTLGTYEALFGSWKAVLRLPERYEKITGAQVQQAAQKYFDAGRRSVVRLVPDRSRAVSEP